MTYKIGAKEYKRNYYIAHREDILKRRRAYLLTHGKERSEYGRDYYTKNKTEIARKQRKYANDNAERLTLYKKNYHLQNKERLVRKAVEWGRANRDKRRITKNKWRSQNREKTNFLARLHIYRRKGAGGYPTLKQVNELYTRYLGLCVYCSLNKATSIDHVVPISRGGTNNIENLLPACVHCNSSKGAKLLSEWKPEL